MTFVAKFKIKKQNPLKATFKIDFNATKVSQLENDLHFQTESEVASTVQTAIDEVTIETDTKIAEVNETIDELSNTVEANYSELNTKITDNHQEITDHISDKANPHEVTKAQVGLGNVDNTSDLNKPISTATQNALDRKVDKTTSNSKLYGTNNNGEQTTLTYGSASTANYVVQRDANSQILVPDTPTASEHATSKKYVDDTAETKVDKVSVANRVYGTDANGIQTTYDYDSFGKVNDVKVGNISVVTNKIANLGTMAGENTNDYSTTLEANSLYAEKTLETIVSNHISDKANPHEVTKAQIGLGNVDNTSDLNKPISTATQNALDENKNDITAINNTLAGYGNIVTHNVSEFATSAQGTLANTALQPNDNITNLTNNAGYITLSALNGYATEDFVTSQGYLSSISSSDVTTALGYTPYNATNPNGYISGIDSTDVVTALGYTPYDSANPDGYITSASLPTVNNNTITIQKNNTNIGSFTLNQSSNDTINIIVPTDTNDLTNGAGFITSASLPTLEDLTTTSQLAAINSGATSANIGQIATNASNISAEVTNRQNADNALQSQIDAIVSASDVFDIVGTYAELQAYDISTVPVNDIIKVLVDSTHSGAATYYRCVENNNLKSWSYIGSEGAYYTKGEADSKFVEKTITINDQPLSSNITLTASDVNALPSSTTIGTGILTVQKNGTTIDTFGANDTGNTTINITVPTDTSDLTNNAGFITGITGTNVTNALGYTPYDSSNPSGYTSNIGTVTSVNDINPISGNVTLPIPSMTSDLTNDSGFITSSDLINYVTTNTDQNITGTKTFVGQKKIGFKQSDNSDKLGFTLYTSNNTEKGYLEYNPSNTVDSVPLMTLGNYANSAAGLTHVGFRKYSSISGANGAYNLLTPLISDAKTPFNLTTTYTNFYLPLGFTDGTNTVKTAKSGLVDLSSILPSVVTETTVSNWGFTKNTGTVTSVNNIQPDDSGNVSITIPSSAAWGNITGTLSDQTDLQNALNLKVNSSDLATVATTGSYTDLINKPYVTTNTGITYVGGSSSASTSGTALGYSAGTTGVFGISIGRGAKSKADYAYQIGLGNNTTSYSLSIGFGSAKTYTLLDGNTGLIPDARISSSIARASAIPTVDQIYSASSTNAQSGVAVASAISGKADLATTLSGYGITDAYTKTQVDGMISSVYKPAGSVVFASLPALSASVLGNVYDVTDAFTTTSDFLEGAGKSYPANTNVVVVDAGTSSSPSYKFDVLSGFVDLSDYQPLLVSGTNIKTINNISLLGSGNISIDTTIPIASNGSYVPADGEAVRYRYASARSYNIFVGDGSSSIDTLNAANKRYLSSYNLGSVGGITLSYSPSGDTLNIELNYDTDTLALKSGTPQKLSVKTATPSTRGIVQPDNSTITIDANGVISASSSGGLQNTATGTDSLTILGTPATDNYSINIGDNSNAARSNSIAIGNSANTISQYSVAIGYGAKAGDNDNSSYGSVCIGSNAGGDYTKSKTVSIGASAQAKSVGGIAIGDNAEVGNSSYQYNNGIAIGNNAQTYGSCAIQLGTGANSTDCSLYVGFDNTDVGYSVQENWQLLDGTTGLIPDARISSNIARTPTYDSTNERLIFSS